MILLSWMTDTRHLLGLWLHHTNQNDSLGLPQISLQLNKGSSTWISTLSYLPVVDRGWQGLMHSHSHLMMKLRWLHPKHAFLCAA